MDEETVTQFFRETMVGRGRWMSYYYQLDQVMRLSPSSVLEIGLGNAVVSDYLRRRIPHYVSLDIDSSAPSDVYGSVTKIPFSDLAFDVVLCAEVLEHLPFDQFKPSLRELGRVARRNIVLSIPQSGAGFALTLSFPGVQHVGFGIAISTHRKHLYNGLHYWEIGWAGYSIKRIRSEILAAGFEILSEIHPVEILYNRFFILGKCAAGNVEMSTKIDK